MILHGDQAEGDEHRSLGDDLAQLAGRSDGPASNQEQRPASRLAGDQRGRANSSSANWSMARGASASTKAECSWSGPNRRVAVSYSRPVKTRPEAGLTAEIRTSQILSNVGSNLEKASASSVSRLPLSERTRRDRDGDDPGRADKATDLGLPLLEQTAGRAWSIRAEGSNER